MARFTKEHPKAADTLNHDWERMVAFYDFPATNWKRLRTTNIIESPFASGRLRTAAAKRFRNVEKATILLWKLLMVAEKRWRRLNDPERLAVWQGQRFVNGEPVATPVSTVEVARSRIATPNVKTSNHPGTGLKEIAMPNVVYIHGTGTRWPAYESSLGLIRKALGDYSDLSVHACYWGEIAPTLEPQSKCLPLANEKYGHAEDTQESLREVWEALNEDPFLELRIRVSTEPGGKLRPPGSVGNVPPLEWLRNLDKRVLSEVDPAALFPDVIERLLTSKVWQEFVARGITVADAKFEIARALSALLVVAYKERDDLCVVEVDPDARRNLEEAISTSAPESYGISSAISGAFMRLAHPVLRWGIARRRQQIIQTCYPFAGDILLYQARGQAIRNYISDYLSNLAQQGGPSIVVAHSLGGIIMADACCLDAKLPVKRLITVGSQVGLFYELGALQGLQLGQPLPAHFPSWTNVYDPNDLLSFRVAPIFGECGEFRVDNGLAFPSAHEAYWSNATMWKLLFS